MKARLGFPIDPKNFNPLKLSINGKRVIETSKNAQSLNPMQILETLGAINRDEESNDGKINALKTIFDRINPL